MEADEHVSCAGCSITLREPYILCAECSEPLVYVCLQCFARGFELATHESNHKYEVVKNDFQLFDKGWSAAEELQLLEHITEFGIGNWSDIAKQMRTKTKDQCKYHYIHRYVENPPPTLPVFSLPDLSYFPSPVPYRVCEDPPRPVDNSRLQSDMSGYMAARSDFLCEYDNFAESRLTDIEFYDSEEPLDRDMKFSVIDIYLTILKERQRRKRIIRQHGLIHIRKQILFNRHYERHLGKVLSDNLIKFNRLLKPVTWDLFLQQLQTVQELKISLEQLRQFRKAGVRTLTAGHLYEKLRVSRQEMKRSRKGLMEQLTSQFKDERMSAMWLQKHRVLDSLAKGLPLPLPNEIRRAAPPLYIVGMPSYDKLNEEERKLCSMVRLVPESFLEFRDLLIKEASTGGHLKLAQARTLIKIDVNKTRKIFDFLVESGYINKT